VQGIFPTGPSCTFDPGQGTAFTPVWQNATALPNGRGFRLRRVTWKSTPSNQGCLLLVWPLLRRGSFTPVLLRGPAPNGHPCPNGALAASMRLGPLRKTCVQPAPKSHLAVSGPFLYEDQKQINSRSMASRLKPVLRGNAVPWMIVPTLCVGMHPGTLRVDSRLKPVPLNARGFLVGPASAGKRPSQAPAFLDCPQLFSGTGFSREEASPGSGGRWLACDVPGLEVGVFA
jgi:hypothetical protein